MNEIISVANVQGYLDASNTAWLNAEDVARGFGFTETKNGVEYVMWRRLNDYLGSFGYFGTGAENSPRVGKGDYLPENMVYRLGFKANNEVAVRFQTILADEVLPSIRKTGTYISPNAAANAKLQEAEVKVYLVEAISRNLRLNEASRLGMYQSIAEPYGLSIPQYVPSEGVMKSASVLLKEIGSNMSVIKFNQLLEKNGYLESISRPTTGGKSRNFKNITEKGTPYGQNMQNPKNQKETQPYWYADKFMELYGIVTNPEQS